MDRYTKGFIVSSLVYFVLAAVLGLWMGIGGGPGWARFAHVHFNLLGFMAMMVYGVGYFVIPRFNARPLRWPSWVPVHFYLANVGLLGMAATYPRIPSLDFVLFAGLSVVSAVLFGVNLIATILAPAAGEEPEVPPAPAPAPRPEVHIAPDMRVGEILTKWPWLGEVFAANGFPSLGDPGHQEQVKRLPVTLAMACERHGVDVLDLIPLLTEAAQEVPSGASAPPQGVGELRTGDAIGPGHVLGEILAAYPQTKSVFQKYYGSGCFSCPGQATESVKQSAAMHNVDLKAILEDLNRAAAA